MRILYYFKEHGQFWAEVDGELWGFVPPDRGSSNRHGQLGLVGPYDIFKEFGCVDIHEPGKLSWIFTAEIIESRLTGHGPEWAKETLTC